MRLIYLKRPAEHREKIEFLINFNNKKKQKLHIMQIWCFICDFRALGKHNFSALVRIYANEMPENFRIRSATQNFQPASLMLISFLVIKGGDFNDDDQPRVIRISSDRVTQRSFCLHTFPMICLHEAKSLQTIGNA